LYSASAAALAGPATAFELGAATCVKGGEVGIPTLGEGDRVDELGARDDAGLATAAALELLA
jgi:hypothetical protein